MYANIVQGLEAKECSEVMVVGSCIQLLLSGPAITTELADYYRRSSKDGCKEVEGSEKEGHREGSTRDSDTGGMLFNSWYGTKLTCCYSLQFPMPMLASLPMRVISGRFFFQVDQQS